VTERSSPFHTHLLHVTDLRTEIRTPEGVVRAVDGVSFALAPGRVLGIVGESGSGKSVTALSIMGLLPKPAARTVGGSVRFEDRELLALPDRAMRDIRGDRMAMIFQEPMTSLNPAFTVGEQIDEAIRRHRAVSAAAARHHTVALLTRVGIPEPERRAEDYPHKLSGGMRQRAMIAMALACDPVLLIADEPTTALDVTIQAQILQLLHELRSERGLATILITHDLGVIGALADEVAVMYAGRIVEQAPVAALFQRPHHPYTIGLLGSVPDGAAADSPLPAIQGVVPNPLALPTGCRFHPRCPFAIARCCAEEPPLAEIEPGHAAACWRAPLGADAAEAA